jgi:hypothetical protein
VSCGAANRQQPLSNHVLYSTVFKMSKKEKENSISGERGDTVTVAICAPYLLLVFPDVKINSFRFESFHEYSPQGGTGG